MDHMLPLSFKVDTVWHCRASIADNGAEWCKLMGLNFHLKTVL